MVKIRVLLENTGSSRGLKGKHGLSIAIDSGSGNLLLDVGPNALFARNAEKMGYDLGEVDNLVLSHAHRDHTGGLDEFCRLNDRARIFLLDDPGNRYFARVFGLFAVSVGLACSPESRGRITPISEDCQIDGKSRFIRNRVAEFPKPRANGNLFKKTSAGLVPDDFTHEGILVVDDGGELVIFNSCSHNGVRNSVECVKRTFPCRRIRSYVGGFHFRNPAGGSSEDARSLDAFTEYVRGEGLHLYTGHCTGEHNYDYMKSALGGSLDRLSTGAELSV